MDARPVSAGETFDALPAHLVGEGGAGEGGAEEEEEREEEEDGVFPFRFQAPAGNFNAAAARKFELSRHGERRGEDVRRGENRPHRDGPGRDSPIPRPRDPPRNRPPGRRRSPSYEDPGRGGAQPDGLSNVHDVVLFCDLVERIVTWNPEDRLHPDDALAHQFFGGGRRGRGWRERAVERGGESAGLGRGFEMDLEMDLWTTRRRPGSGSFPPDKSSLRVRRPVSRC